MIYNLPCRLLLLKEWISYENDCYHAIALLVEINMLNRDLASKQSSKMLRLSNDCSKSFPEK